MIPPTVATAALPDPPMSFLDHLEELRRALLRVAIVAVVLVGTAWAFSGRLLDALIVTLAPGQRVLALAPAEAFAARMNVALWAGGLVAVPYLMYEAWRFVAPGLKRDERRFAVPWMLASAALLYAGITFALRLLLPTMVTMLASFATPNIESRLSLSPLLGFAIQLAAGCGLLFQLPVVLCLLAWFGLVPPSRLARAWRHAIFFIALGSAIITPGDGPSMLILAAPLVVLYFLSVLAASLLWKLRNRSRAENPETG
jgi:sec-independent protein translocase protein TatC